MSDYIYRVMHEVSPGVFRSRPVGGSPGYEYKRGEWTPRIKNPVECKRGYHTLSAAGLLEYACEGDAIVRCRYRGQVAGSRGKAVNERVMPVEVVGYATTRALRLTAADAAGAAVDAAAGHALLRHAAEEMEERR